MVISFIKNSIKKYRLRRTIKQYAAFFDIHTKALLLPDVSFDIRSANPRVRLSVDEKAVVGCNFIFESESGEIRIGKRTYIGAGTKLISRSGIYIGNDVTIAWGCWLYDHNSHSLDWHYRVKDIEQVYLDYNGHMDIIANKDWSVVNARPIHICDKAWIGFNAIILKGVTIGEGAIVGAGAVVTRDVPAWTVVAGNPARVVKKLQPEGMEL